MTVTMFRAKLHRLRVTEADLYYEGSITIDEELLGAAGILPYEKVQIVNVNNGRRLWTLTTCTFSYGRMPAASSNSSSMVIEPS